MGNFTKFDLVINRNCMHILFCLLFVALMYTYFHRGFECRAVHRVFCLFAVFFSARCSFKPAQLVRCICICIHIYWMNEQKGKNVFQIIVHTYVAICCLLLLFQWFKVVSTETWREQCTILIPIACRLCVRCVCWKNKTVRAKKRLEIRRVYILAARRYYTIPSRAAPANQIIFHLYPPISTLSYNSYWFHAPPTI